MVLDKKDLRVPGFLASGIDVGIKDDGGKDLSLIFSEVPAVAAGVFTKNRFKSAPVILDMERIKKGVAQAIVANSGNANAATGDKGYEDALAMSEAVSSKLHIKDNLVLVASTGIIGQSLPIKKIKDGIGRLVEGLSPDGILNAEEAIMTTDTFPKVEYRKGEIGSKEITICGIAKGAGMIEPDMATMLSFIMTDADISRRCLDSVFRQAVDFSFNAITVDGCMSTNDTAIILANGVAGNKPIAGPSKNLTIFKEMLFDLMVDLSKAIVRDGEGATKVIEIVVDGAKTLADAKKVAYGIARSNLVKTAFFGEDTNWGRIVSAVGASGVNLSTDAMELYVGEVLLFVSGKGTRVDEERLIEMMGEDYIRILVKLGMGNKSICIYTTDLSYDYVKINAHYQT
ncbi:MAG: bifunctional glutamate N-acetyltransferase/amino-acid acetyltransferase ArgJ [Thermodesulfobacteriota bacterium]|nr:bifunctional glutamate N-acetyltransferase/amino-acid acetyltransferase ArgJ [Thermodesulfobacteriota bacterium]